MRAWLVIALVLLASSALAQVAPTAITSVEEMHRACRESRERTRPVLYAIELERFAFGAWLEDDGVLLVDTRRNLSAFDGRVSLLPAGLETIALQADQAAADRLRAATGTRLRIGFFLGFDEPERDPCLVRSAAAVTIVRYELAYAELLDARGQSIARADTDRLRAWADDAQALAIEGRGPRGALGDASFDDGQPAPEAWRRAVSAASVGAELTRCHTAGIARGAALEGRVIVRLNVETRTGRVRRADVALSSLGDSEDAECVARAVGAAVRLPAGPSEWRVEVVDLSVPVRLAAD